jgi:hypothetical protein
VAILGKSNGAPALLAFIRMKQGGNFLGPMGEFPRVRQPQGAGRSTARNVTKNARMLSRLPRYLRDAVAPPVSSTIAGNILPGQEWRPRRSSMSPSMHPGDRPCRFPVHSALLLSASLAMLTRESSIPLLPAAATLSALSVGSSEPAHWP